LPAGRDGTGPDGAEAAGVLRALSGDGIALSCVVLLLALSVAAIFGVLLGREAAFRSDIANALLPPSFDHPMGTDANGRSVAVRFLYGAAITLSSSTAIVVIATLLGGFLGIVAGLGGRVSDTLVMRLLDAILAFPPIVLAMCVAVGMGGGLWNAIVGTALSCVPYYGRLLRSDIVRIRSQPFIASAVALGVPRHAIVRRHILPHTLPTMLVQSASVFGASALMLSALSFVGLGAKLPTPEWGAMITDGLRYAVTGQWWVSVFPGIGLLLVAASAHVLGDRLRIYFSPDEGHR